MFVNLVVNTLKIETDNALKRLLTLVGQTEPVNQHL
jgi:hypothetical protein